MSENNLPPGVGLIATGPTPPAPQPPPVNETNAPAAAEPAIRKLQPGDRVQVVHTWDGHIEGRIERVRGDGKIDVIIMDRGEEMRLTSAPFDPTGTKPDSWHFPSN